jgi:hypothetical protein
VPFDQSAQDGHVARRLELREDLFVGRVQNSHYLVEADS